jgi:hypothetical protein
MMRRSLTARIRRERWRRKGIGEYAISVDKSNLPVRERGTNHQLQAARNLRKNPLASGAGLCMIVIVTSKLIQSFCF